MAAEWVEVMLTADEALVLFEFLSRFTDTNELRIVDQAEERVLWDLCAELEGRLLSPLNPSYANLLSLARDAIRDNG